MTCSTCGGRRFVHLTGKAVDLNSARFEVDGETLAEGEGYVPDLFFGEWGDYIHLNLCMDCGHLENFERHDDAEIISTIEGM